MRAWIGTRPAIVIQVISSRELLYAILINVMIIVARVYVGLPLLCIYFSIYPIDAYNAAQGPVEEAWMLARAFDASEKLGRDLALSATDDAPKMLCSAFAHSCLFFTSSHTMTVAL